MAKAEWNGAVIAESENFELVEGNIYFPASSVCKEYLQRSSHKSFCPWKGDAHYFTIVVDGKENEDAAWYYPDPYERALHIKGHIAFWKGVKTAK